MQRTDFESVEGVLVWTDAGRYRRYKSAGRQVLEAAGFILAVLILIWVAMLCLS